jgi:hypothetical protein
MIAEFGRLGKKSAGSIYLPLFVHAYVMTINTVSVGLE